MAETNRYISGLFERAAFFCLVAAAAVVPLVFCAATSQVWGLVKTVTCGVLVIAGFCFWVLSMNQRGRFNFVFTPLAPPVIAFFVLSCLSAFWALNRWEAAWNLFLLFCNILLFFLAANTLNSKKRLFTAAWALLISGFAACLFSMYRDLGPYFFTALRQTVISTFGHPVFFSQYLIIVFPLALMLFAGAENKSVKFALGIFTAAFAYFILLCRTRSTWFGLSAVFLLFALYLLRYKKNLPAGLIRLLRWKNILVLLLCLLLLAGAFSLFSNFRVWKDELVERFYSAFDVSYVTNLMRLRVWSNTMRMLADSNFLGVGLGNFPIKYPLYRSAEEIAITPEGKTYLNPHNDYLQIAVESGVLALIAFLWLAFAAVRMCVLVMKKTRDKDYYYLISGILLGFGALLIHCFFNPTLRIPASAMAFWLEAGLIAAIYRRELYADTGHAAGIEAPVSGGGIFRRYAVMAAAVICFAAGLWVFARVYFSDIYFKKAQVLKKEERTLEALSFFEKSISLYPGNYEAYFLAGNCYQELKRYPEAFQQYDLALKMHPYQPVIYNNLGTIYLKSFYYDKAITAFQKAVSINPYYSGAHYNLYLAYESLGRRGEAEKELVLASDIRPDFVGQLYLDQGKYDDAIAAYDKALKENPDDADTHFKLGLIYGEKTKYDQAISQFRKTIRLKPGHIGAYRQMGVLLLKNRENYDEAEGVYKKLVSLVPADAEARLNLGYIYSEKGNFFAAEEEFKKAISLNPYFIKSYIYLSRVYLHRSDFDRAAAVLKEALVANPDSEEAKTELQNIYRQKFIK